MMGKKEYQLFADAISQIEDLAKQEEIKAFLFPLFKSDNERFSEERFNDWVDRRINHKSMKGTRYNPKYMPLGI